MVVVVHRLPNITKVVDEEHETAAVHHVDISPWQRE
jgi:hypothetical protein